MTCVFVDAQSTEPDDDDDDLSEANNTEEDCFGEDLSLLPSEGYQVMNESPQMHPPLLPFNGANEFISLSSFRTCGASEAKWSRFLAGKQLTRNWSLILLVFVPVGIVAPQIGVSYTAVFIFNCLAIIPLADVLCRSTDSMSKFLGDVTGAMLNVTIGNGTEVVIFHALMQRQYVIVRTSLIGSSIVNVLLVLGLAILAGEVQARGQVYNLAVARVTAYFLFVSTISLLIPTIVQSTPKDARNIPDMLKLSRAISIVLIVVYLGYLFAQIKSAKQSYNPLTQTDPETPVLSEFLPEMEEIHMSYELQRTNLFSSDPDENGRFNQDQSFDDSTDWTMQSTRSSPLTCGVVLTKSLPVVLLVVSTGLISICAKYLVDSIDHFVAHTRLNKTTIGLIILPLVGNAAELVSAVIFASRKQIDLAFAVSVGSAIQISLFVTPLIVIIGWSLGRDMTLSFTIFEAISFLATTILYFFLAIDKKCSVLKGVLLCAGYVAIGLGSVFFPALSMN